MNNELIELLKTLENIAAAEYSDYELAERASKAIQSLQEAEPVEITDLTVSPTCETNEMIEAAIGVFHGTGSRVDLGYLGQACRAYLREYLRATPQPTKVQVPEVVAYPVNGGGRSKPIDIWLEGWLETCDYHEGLVYWATIKFIRSLTAAPAQADKELWFTHDNALAECPCCSSLDVGAVENNAHCYGCGLTITKFSHKEALDAWNTRGGKLIPKPPTEG